VLTVNDSGSTQVLRIAGDLDLATAGQVTAALDRLELNGTSLLVIDLQRLNFLDLADSGPSSAPTSVAVTIRPGSGS
jgi:anti-anti-sigma regulatory factor